MTVHKVDDLVMNSLVKKANKDIIMMGVCISSGKCQLFELLEEFLGHLTSLTQKRQLVLGIGFLIGVLKGFFTSSAEGSESAPIWYHGINDLVDEIGGELLRESSYEETEVESDVSVVIHKFTPVCSIVEKLFTLECVPILCVSEVFWLFDVFLFGFSWGSGCTGSWTRGSTSSWCGRVCSSSS